MPPLVTYASGQRCVVSPTECRLPCPPMSVLSRTFLGLEGPVARSELLGQWSAPRKVLQGVPFRVSVPSYLPTAGFSGQQLSAYSKRRLVPLSRHNFRKNENSSSLGILLFDLYNSSQFFQRHSATRLFRENCPPDGTRAGSFPRDDANVFLRASKARWQTMGRR